MTGALSPATEASAAPIHDEWAKANPISLALHERARGVIPDGVTHDVRQAEPFPLAVARAEGSRKWDVDGHELLCYVLGHGALLLGHSHPAVVEAIQAQAPRFAHPGACHELEVEWAEEIVRLVPSAERVRFTSSGTEATMLALQVARAATGRQRIVKLEGHFHGWHDYAAFGNEPPFDAVPPGIPPELGDRLITVVAADTEQIEQVLANGDVAAVILEPSGAVSGAVPLPDGFLARLRQITQQHGSLLIFDEIVTGFRWAPGGVQESAGVTPDLTALGKVVAGGMAGAALAGRADVMEWLDTRAERAKVRHTGTHNAHPVAAAAGLAALRLLADGEPQRTAAARARVLCEGFDDILVRQGVPGFAYGSSSRVCIMLGMQRPADTNPSWLADNIDPGVLRAGTDEVVGSALDHAMQLEGVHLHHCRGFLSSAHSEDDVARTLSAFETSVRRLGELGIV